MSKENGHLLYNYTLQGPSYLLCSNDRMTGVPSINFYYSVFNSRSTTSGYNLTFGILLLLTYSNFICLEYDFEVSIKLIYS
jgi:hypothetical protein